MDNTKHAVAATGLLVAAMRAEESVRDDALFHDPFAERLAGDDGRRLLAESSSETGQPSAPIVVRTRLFDEALLGAHADGVSQVVIVAAGIDARSFRLPWPGGVTVYEVDQPQVIAIKEERLAGERPRCQRVAVGVDLADDWPKRFSRRDSTPRRRRSGRSRGCCSTSKRPMSTGCSRGGCIVGARLDVAVRRRRQDVARSAVLAEHYRVHAKASAHHGSSAATHRAHWSRAEAGPRQSPIWLCPATRGSVGSTRRFRPMCPERRAATSSRRRKA